MKFSIISDLHGDCDFIQPSPELKDVYLIIAGDVHEVHKKARYKEIINHFCSIYKEVFLVPGNHEYYGSSIHGTNDKLCKLSTEISNFNVVLNNEFIIENGEEKVLIVGGTLWTDFNRNNPIDRYNAQTRMNDYRCIRHGPVHEHWKIKFRTEDAYNFHLQTKDYIKNSIDNNREICNNIKVLVCTHHAPSYQSVSPLYLTDLLNSAYVSNMDDFIYLLQPDVWVHGHVHSNFDYYIDKTRILCNPHGYGSENLEFNPNFIIEI